MKRYVITRKSAGLALALAVPLLSLLPSAGTGGRSAPDAEALFEKKCSLCHGLSLTTTRREWKQEWREIVQQMARKREGWLTAEEAAAIVEYLSSAYGRE